jgi:LmbE family N-acetylglucosaminyl deacetylase
MNKIALGIFAHPDDAEFMCAGTLALFRKEGWSIHIASLAKGDKGTTLLSKEEISSIRKEEGIKSAKLLEGTYHCLELDDVYIFYNNETINKTTGLIRKVRPSIVFTGSPNDYMLDHEITSMIVQTACFSCGIKNMDVEEKPFEPIPYLYFCDSMEGLDKFGRLIQPSIYVNISSEIKTKIRMLACHASQRNWLLDHHKMDEFTGFVEDLGRLRGTEVDFDFAEGFRQCLGHSYQTENILKQILGDLVTTKEDAGIKSNLVVHENK